MTSLFNTLSVNGWERSANERSAIENPQYSKSTKIVDFTVATHTTLDEISILQDNSCNRFMIFRKAYGATSSQMWLYNKCFIDRSNMHIPVEKMPTIRDILKGFKYSDAQSVQTKFSQNQSEILDMPLCVNTDSFKHPEIHIICDNELKMKEEQKKFTEEFRKKEQELKEKEQELKEKEENPIHLEKTLKTVDEFINSITRKLPKSEIIKYIELYY